MKKAERPVAARGTNNISVRLPNELIAWVDEQATKARRSRGAFIRIVLEDLREKIERLQRPKP